VSVCQEIIWAGSKASVKRFPDFHAQIVYNGGAAPSTGKAMAEKITVEFPDDLMEQVRTTAAHTQRSPEEVLLDWARRAVAEPTLALLPDAELLAACDTQLVPSQQEELSELLERNREGTLIAAEHARLDELMRLYRTGLVRKAQALKLAVSRGLRPRLT
jgi:hypothetical protein